MLRLSIALIALLAGTVVSVAHEGVAHPKCKKGYVLDDNHRCVRKG